MSRTKRLGWEIVAIVLVLAVIIGLFASCEGGGEVTHKKNTCKVCGRTFEAGDQGGNFKSIAYSGMCKNCLKNYEAAQKMLGK